MFAAIIAALQVGQRRKKAGVDYTAAPAVAAALLASGMGKTSRDCHTQFFAAFFSSAEVFSVPAIAKLQRHRRCRARIAAIAS